MAAREGFDNENGSVLKNGCLVMSFCPPSLFIMACDRQEDPAGGQDS